MQNHYQFDDLTLDVAQRRVARRGRPIELSALNFDLLKVLVESAPNVVTNDELAEKVWGQHFVSPENVAQRVMLLRQSLSDDAARPRYIERVRNKGYRLVGSARTAAAEHPPRSWRGPRWLVSSAATAALALGVAAAAVYWLDRSPLSTAALAPAKVPNSIAILPFDNRSPDPEDAYFAVGIHEEIIGQLAKTPSLNVIARTSVQRYANGSTPIRRIGEELNVETVMEGSVRYSGDRVRITALVSDAATGAVRWSQSYDRELGDVFAIQEDIASNIAAALGQELSAQNRLRLQAQATRSPEAASLYLKVLGLRREFSYDSAAQHRYLDQALAFDPEFANAYALKASVYAISVSDVAGGRAEDTDPAELERLAVQNANKALALDAHSAQAYQALGLVDRLHWRWKDALRNFAKAYELAPNNIEALVGYAGMLSLTGNHPEAVRLMERAAQLDPVSPGVRFNLGVVLAQAGRPAAAAAVLRDAAVMAPDAAHIRHWLGHTEARLSNRAAALTELRTAERLSVDVDPNPTLLTGLLYSYSRVDQSEDVARLFTRLQARTADWRVSPGTWALAYLALGETDQALHWLRIAVAGIEKHEPDAGSLNLQTIKTNVHANPILDEPPFSELRERIGALN